MRVVPVQHDVRLERAHVYVISPNTLLRVRNGRLLLQEIRALKEKTESNRRDFPQVELQTCFVAIDRARFELSMGKVDEAEKELEVANRGRQVIERFFSEAAVQMPEIAAKLARLKAALASLRSDLNTHPG